ncbi:hypothetical protein GWI33_008403 [Rhynchophorus ferrugineus]|uniref:Spondin domain-containing protein n=1 Tax=Rhynchophorus ferrugineus TaxID=354439 RepID=A0A834MB41_RHYFE|nr:hypothetical protein GWI33_008403 [Rhynchophorus ferrugineus]
MTAESDPSKNVHPRRQFAQNPIRISSKLFESGRQKLLYGTGLGERVNITLSGVRTSPFSVNGISTGVRSNRRTGLASEEDEEGEHVSNARLKWVVGRSHDKSYVLFRLGKKSSAGVKAFAETGRSDLLEQHGQGDGGVYDEFNAPPITSGVGRTEAEFFVDGNHSKVSLMSRIVPSPDWFIGIDSFDLCVNGNWLDSITIEVDPVDAGTDNGFTFTAPNWPTDPQGEAYRITAHYPAHPAGSFFYPYLKRLPPIATFQFIKIKEYELSEVFHHSEDDRRYDVLKMENLSPGNLNSADNNDIEIAIEEERQEQEIHQRAKVKPKSRSNNYYTDYKRYTVSTPQSTSTYTEDNKLSNTLA